MVAPPVPPVSRSTLAAVTALTGLALGLRLVTFGDSLAGDEVSTLYDVRRSLPAVIELLVEGPRASNEYTPPLYFVLAWLATQASDSVEAIRVPSLLASVGLVPLLFALGRRVFSARVGLLAAAVWALMPSAIFYGVEGRAYALLAALGAASTYALLRALREGGRRWWIAYALLGAGVAYTHYTGAAVLVAQAAWALRFSPGRRRAVLLANAGALALFAPWLPFVRTEETVGIYAAIGPRGVREHLRVVAEAFPGHPFASPARVPGTVAVVVLGLVLAACGGWWLVSWGRRRPGLRETLAPPAALLAVVGLASPLGLLALSAAEGQTVFLARSLTASVPAAVLLVCALVSAPPRAAGVAATVVLLAVVELGAGQTLSRDHRRPDFEALARYVDATARADEPVVNATFSAPDAAAARFLSINFRRPHPEAFLGAGDGPAWRGAVEHPGRRVFLVVPQAGGFPALAKPPGPPGRFAEVERRRVDGFIAFEIVVYRAGG